MRTPTEKAKSSKNLKLLITETVKLWRRHHLSYDQVRYVSKEARKALGLERVKIRKRVVQRLSQDKEKRLIQAAYRDRSEHGLLVKTLFQSMPAANKRDKGKKGSLALASERRAA